VPRLCPAPLRPVEIIPGHRKNDSGLMRKPFAFPPESLFAFSPESCSSSPRNAFRVHPGIPFALPRNPQFSRCATCVLRLKPLRPSFRIEGDPADWDRKQGMDTSVTE
jgi:hypothetical protein